MSSLPRAIGAAMLWVPDDLPETDATYVGTDLFAVADGVDHQPGSGARALTQVARLAPRRRGRSLAGAVRVADWALWYEDAAAGSDDGVATVTVASWTGRRFVIASVGDSHAYLVRAGHATNLLDVGAAPDPASDDAVPRVGRSPAGERLEIVTVTPRTGDRLVLCTDGLWRILDPELLAVAGDDQDPAALCRALRKHAEAYAVENAAAVVAAVSPG